MEATKQMTLKGSFSLFGKGLHTGLSLTVTFNPAPENTGLKIQRIDLEGQPTIDALAEYVVDTQRGTVIAKGDVRVGTIEHGMAASTPWASTTASSKSMALSSLFLTVLPRNMLSR